MSSGKCSDVTRLNSCGLKPKTLTSSAPNWGLSFVLFCRPPPSVPVSKAQLAKLQVIFENIDVSKTGTVYCSEILSVVDMTQSPFTDNLFKLVGKGRSHCRCIDRWLGASPRFGPKRGAHERKTSVNATHFPVKSMELAQNTR